MMKEVEEIEPVDKSMTEEYRYGLPRAEPETVGMSAKRLTRIKPAMQSFIDADKVPGLLTVIARHGKVVHFETQGYADTKPPKPLKADTIFRLYSQTKPITGVAVMIAYEQGHFLLNDPVAKYLPEFREMKVYTDSGLIDAKGPITIRQLLTHTSGLDYGWYPDDPVASLYREAGLEDANARLSLSTEDYVKKLAALPLFAQPGTQWRYSDAMAVLGRLVEVVSGKTYRDFLKEQLFSPLDMIDTDFFVPVEKLHRLAQLYEVGPEGGLVAIDACTNVMHDKHTVSYSNYGKQPSFESGGAGLVGSATDYLRFAQMLLNGGELDDVRILSPTSVNLILSNHLGLELGETPLASLGQYVPDFNRKGLGFGFCGYVVTDAIASGTAGSEGEYAWGGAASTRFWLDPKQHLIGMVLTQLVPDGTYPIFERLHQMTYQAIIGN